MRNMIVNIASLSGELMMSGDSAPAQLAEGPWTEATPPVVVVVTAITSLPAPGRCQGPRQRSLGLVTVESLFCLLPYA